MSSTPTRYGFPCILLHWALALVALLALASGWYVRSLPPEAPARGFLLDVHASLGLTGAALLILQVALRIASRPPGWPEGFPLWQRRLHSGLYLLAYASLALLLLSGFLQAVFTATPLAFWGRTLPVWGAVDPGLAGFFGAAHRHLALLLAGLIVAHVGLVIFDLVKHPELAGRMSLIAPQGPCERLPAASAAQAALAVAEKLAQTLRLSGWIAFCFQLAIAFISMLLLVFATSGHAFSPGSAHIGHAIYWSGHGFLLLCLALLLDFLYTRAARKIMAGPESCLGQGHRAAFWPLGAGLATGLAGTAVALVGVALSIALLIAKTVSQPPGIAITDPTRIVRALDVFVLMVNFNLLMAHFAGTGISLWLIVRVAKARREYARTTASREGRR